MFSVKYTTDFICAGLSWYCGDAVKKNCMEKRCPSNTAPPWAKKIVTTTAPTNSAPPTLGESGLESNKEKATGTLLQDTVSTLIPYRHTNHCQVRASSSQVLPYSLPLVCCSSPDPISHKRRTNIYLYFPKV